MQFSLERCELLSEFWLFVIEMKRKANPSDPIDDRIKIIAFPVKRIAKYFSYLKPVRSINHVMWKTFLLLNLNGFNSVTGKIDDWMKSYKSFPIEQQQLD